MVMKKKVMKNLEYSTILKYLCIWAGERPLG